MSKATKRKHVRQEVCDPEWQPPGPGQALARVLAGRGNNLHEVMVANNIPSTHARPPSPQVIPTKTGTDSASTKNSSDQKSAVLAGVVQGDERTSADDDNKHMSTKNGVSVVSADGDAKGKDSAQFGDCAEKRILASMPRKFRRSVWVRRGDVVVVEWIPEGEKVKAEIVSVILRKMVHSLRASGELEWPPEFDHPDFGDVEKSRDESESGEEDEEDFLPANTNRRPPLEVETSSSSTTSTSSTASSSSSDDEDSESEDDVGNEGAGSVFENPNRRTVSRSVSKSESSQSDVDNVIEGRVK